MTANEDDDVFRRPASLQFPNGVAGAL